MQKYRIVEKCYRTKDMAVKKYYIIEEFKKVKEVNNKESTMFWVFTTQTQTTEEVEKWVPFEEVEYFPLSYYPYRVQKEFPTLKKAQKYLKNLNTPLCEDMVVE